MRELRDIQTAIAFQPDLALRRQPGPADLQIGDLWHGAQGYRSIQPPGNTRPFAIAQLGDGKGDAAQVRGQVQMARPVLGQGDRNLTRPLTRDHAFGQAKAKLLDRALRQGDGAIHL